MDIYIKDPRNGNSAEVTADFRLKADAIATTESERLAFDGRAYNLNSGVIELTSANESALFYLSHANTSRSMVVTGIGYDIVKESNDTIETPLVYIYRNPNTGTIIDNALVGPIAINKLFSSGESFPETFYVGVEGDTFTSGTQAYISVPPKIITTGNLVLRSGDHLGISVQPPPSNTSMKIIIFASVSFKDN